MKKKADKKAEKDKIQKLVDSTQAVRDSAEYREAVKARNPQALHFAPSKPGKKSLLDELDMKPAKLKARKAMIDSVKKRVKGKP